MVDRTQHCTGCKERQDRIAELEAALRDVVVECEDDCWSNAIDIARAALGESNADPQV